MKSKKRILIVGDYDEILQLLRARLGDATNPPDVSGVSSAEEALNRIQKGPVDLLVTDLRMVGTGGLELVRQARKYRPGLKAIILAGRASYREVEQAAELGVARFFKKTMDRDRLLVALMDALGQTEQTVKEINLEPMQIKLPSRFEPETVPPAVQALLERLQVDTGASLVLLGTLDGDLLASTEGDLGLPWKQLLSSLADTMRRSLRIADFLKNERPKAIQYIPGRKWDLLYANIGRDSYLAVISDTPFERGRFGTLWVYTQRAISDLEPLTGWQQRTPRHETPIKEAIHTPEPNMVSSAMSTTNDRSDHSTETDTNRETVSPELEALLGDILLSQEDEIDLDAFWDEAVATESDTHDSSGGISLEEALKKGILGPDFKFEE